MIKQLHRDSFRSRSLSHVVIVTYTLFLAGFFFVPNAVDHYKFYIVVVFLPGLLRLPTTLRRTRGSLIWLSLLAYLTYTLLSSFWSETFSFAVLWRDMRYTAYLLSFILLTVFLFEYNRRLPQAIMLFVTVVAIVAAIVSMAHILGIRVVAEGIEEPEQLLSFAEMACDFGQGDTMSRPLPVADVVPLLGCALPVSQG